MRIDVMNAGDKVLNVTSDFVAIERTSGEVDIIPLVQDSSGLWIDVKNITTIGYGKNSVQVKTSDGLTITTF